MDIKEILNSKAVKTIIKNSFVLIGLLVVLSHGFAALLLLQHGKCLDSYVLANDKNPKSDTSAVNSNTSSVSNDTSSKTLPGKNAPAINEFLKWNLPVVYGLVLYPVLIFLLVCIGIIWLFNCGTCKLADAINNKLKNNERSKDNSPELPLETNSGRNLNTNMNADGKNINQVNYSSELSIKMNVGVDGTTNATKSNI